ncbi:MAG: transcriptional regulator [Burkholderiales bacterium PBB4]|nr:MAG: transcriptional regulator [Burkholderiales bacterium PBB4]
MLKAKETKIKPSQENFERAAELFGVLSTPVRLQIIGELCQSERNVTHLLGAIDISQPSMSRHLNVLYQAGVVSKRRSGANVFYRIANDSVVSICRAVCAEPATL